MFPNFFIGEKEISAYVITAIIGYFAAGLYACWSFRKRGRSEDEMISFFLLMTIGVLIGGSFIYGITNFPLLVKLVKLTFTGGFSSISEFLGACSIVFGGSVFYGGLLGGMAAGAILIRRRKLSEKLYTDTLAPCIPLFHVFGRLGCFLSGCCFGVESPVGFVYHYSPIAMANGVRRFPVQLVEASVNLCIFLILHRLWQKEKAEGWLLRLYLLMYAPCRFVLEFFRGDTYRGFLFSLSTSQIISILMLLGVLVYTIFEKKKQKMN